MRTSLLVLSIVVATAGCNRPPKTEAGPPAPSGDAAANASAGGPTVASSVGKLAGAAKPGPGQAGEATSGNAPSGAPVGAAVRQGESCAEGGRCATGLTCVSYFGVAGPRGPRFATCEIPCRSRDDRCPSGQACFTIADGPGRVCRPIEGDPAPSPAPPRDPSM